MKDEFEAAIPKGGKLRRLMKICTMILTLCSMPAVAQEKSPLRLITSVPMPGFTGDFDHFGVDLRGNRLFLASEEQKTVEVFNLRTGERVHSITPVFAAKKSWVQLRSNNGRTRSKTVHYDVEQS